jgi:glucokinase
MNGHEIVSVDIGGTHARFAIARIGDGRVLALGEPVTLKTAEYGSLERAWQAFGARIGRPLPDAAAIAIAAPIGGEQIKLTNSPWVIRPKLLEQELSVSRLVLVNDFGAVGHAVAHAGPGDFVHVCGPREDLPADGVVSIVGPGTGLGVALVVRRGGESEVVETEGGHIDFAPLDELEDRILAFLRPRYRRVSIERIVSGPGLANLYEAIASIEGHPVRSGDDAALWKAALAGEDRLASTALDRFCLSLGAAAGDIALAQGGVAVVIAGGVGHRLADHLPNSGFALRFVAKGRLESRMRAMPVKVITIAEPGLLGAAAAYASRHGR